MAGLKDWKKPEKEKVRVEDTLLLIKPETADLGCITEVLWMIHEQLPDLKVVKEGFFEHPSRRLIEAHYANLKDKHYFKWVVDHMTRGPVIAIILRGENAVERLRALAGATDPSKAEEGTIRKTFSQDSIESSNKQRRATFSIIHSSANLAEAIEEVRRWRRAIMAKRARFFAALRAHAQAVLATA